MLKSIKLNDQNNNVSLLHKVLSVLGIKVNATEVQKKIAGDDTLNKVRSLQRRLGIPFDNDFVVDQVTIKAIIEDLTENGLISSGNTFKVSGNVKQASGDINRNQQLVAFDLDLRGVGVYRDLKSLNETNENGGFEYLGEAVSDKKGNYSIHFYDWQYQRAERKLADVVVYAHNDKDEIIGHSRLVNTEDYDKGFVRGLDIITISQDERPEYQMLMDPLSSFLEESNSSLENIAESSDQITFTARELDLDLDRLRLAAVAELVVRGEAKLGGGSHDQSHELLYGIGRQGISLSWAALYKKKEAELIEAITQSVKGGIIAEFHEDMVKIFVRAIEECSISHLLIDKDEDDHNALTEILGNALPEESQHSDFLSALREFSGVDYRAFWEEQLPLKPAFENKPGLIKALQLSQQLTVLAGSHQALVKELQVEKKVTTAESLLDFTHDEWLETLEKTGVPEFVEGKDEKEKRQRYAEGLESRLNATFPTQRIGRMLKENQLSIDNARVAASVGRLFANEKFDIARERIHDFQQEIEAAAELENTDPEEVKAEAMRIQRLYQISDSPEVMTALLKNNLHSSYKIASVPRGNFIKTYGEALGGVKAANDVHQRAEFISRRAEFIATDVMQFSQGNATPDKVMSKAGFAKADALFKKNFPNYENLFGSPDLCECQHCRSVYSPAAYFVDLLRFLGRSTFDFPVDGGDTEPRSPYDYLVGRKDEDSLIAIPGRRPDLAELALSCENTNTLIPYIDLSNEVMEHYVAQDSLSSFEGHNTGDATADELRANPQHQYDVTAYKKLAQANHPFSLPFHQPLDEIRTYGDHLGVSRYEVMRAVNPQPADDTPKAIAAEALQISLEEYTTVTGEFLDGTFDPTPLHEFYGFDSAEIPVDPLAPIGGATISVLETLSPVHEFMARSGVKYIELVELVKTKFINTHQDKLDFLDRIFSHRLESPEVLYSWLESVSTNQASEFENVITTALEDYNSIQKNEESKYTRSKLVNWAGTHFEDVKNILTLFEPDSKCNLDTTRLRTLQSVHEEANTIVVMVNGQEEERLGPSGVTNNNWSLFHRFIRLWRKLGWSIHETDLILTALGENDIRSETITKLEAVLQLKEASKRPLNQLAVLWGNIDTYGQRSLYKKLFLNKATQQIDQAFVADAQGNYLLKEEDNDGESITLIKHQSTILAAFRISEEELAAILVKAQVSIEGFLNLHNLSAIYRYVVLARALKLGVTDLCKLIEIFDPNPFGSAANPGTPAETYAFYQLAASVKKARFKPAVLDYIFNGELSNDSKLGLDKNKVLQAAKTIRSELAVIELDHPEIDDSDPALTSEFVASKLMLCFQPEIVGRFIDVVENTASFHTITEPNLVVTIPDALAGKYSYIPGSGRLICAGIMSDTEKNTLKGLANADTNFKTAVDELYAAPETFLSDHFNSIFTDLAVAEAQADGTDITTAKTKAETTAREVLLDHPHSTVASLEDRLSFVYEHYLPALKRKLRRGVLTSHLADLTGLSQEATAMLIADESEALLGKLTIPGFSASYFNGTDFSALALDRVDKTVDFSWGMGAPHAAVSVRWSSYLTSPESGEYTLVVDVAGVDEAFKLYLDGTLVLEKLKDTAVTRLEVIADFNAAQMHQVTLEYNEFTDSAGIHLRWKTATTGLEIIPSSAVYPAHQLDEFFEFAQEVHRAAKFITGFKLDETELHHFIKYSAEFSDLDFKALTAIHWIRIRDYATLRNSVPQAEALLTDVFALASQTNPEPDMPGLKELILQSTAWGKANIGSLINHFFPEAFDTSLPPKVIDTSLIIDSFKNEVTLNRILKIMQISAKTGLSAETITKWGAAKTDLDTETRFEQLHTTAQWLKNTVKAKYNDTEWLDLAGSLSDKIREKKKQALIAYLLGHESIRGADVSDADGLFEYFLIDVQMGACMDTSRIVQANAAIQLFVNRVLLNLETNIPPDAIDPERWSWMKNYRVWEANRKVFLYPENWLAPEWRKDRSEFFKELESHLLQNDITERSVEQGLRNYLMSLNEVANLDVCGMHQENDVDGKLKFLHVFGRTHNLPYKYFYRRWNEDHKWSAWQKVQVDIRSVEDGENSGVHLVPVVWKGRLFLFWPEFMEMSKESEASKVTPYRGRENMRPGAFEPEKYWEVRLAWSEYVDESWSAKQVSKEHVDTDKYYLKKTIYYDEFDSNFTWFSNLKGFRFAPKINPTTNVLTVSVAYEAKVFPWFRITDIQSPIRIDSPIVNTAEHLPGSNQRTASLKSLPQKLDNYENYFMSRSKSSHLTILNDRYLTLDNHNHRLITDDRDSSLGLSLDRPFFFTHASQKYFVESKKVTVFDRLKYPDRVNPDMLVSRFVEFAGRPDNNPGPLPEAISLGVPRAVSYPSALAVAGAFNGLNDNVGALQNESHEADSLKFHTFYHPYSSKFVTRLNQGGIPALMGSDTEDIDIKIPPIMFPIESDDGTVFGKYTPNFDKGLVISHKSSLDKRTYYQENICFDPFGANSLYNWELFFHAPLYIATRLSKNGKYEEAMKWFHYLFDPTTSEAPDLDNENDTSRYWKVRPFKDESKTVESLESWFRKLAPNTDPENPGDTRIKEWRDNPFDPHLVASNRPIAYMKHVVIKYIENLIDWGDSLFRQFTRESVYEAIQLYVIASHVLGKRPEFVPRRGEIKTETYASIKDKLDDFGNALVELENILPYSSEVNVTENSPGTSLLGIGSALYFCIPANDKLLESWDTVEDRLFKIRHCQDLDGVERDLALFAPPIDPAALIQARSQGLSLGSILADLNSPPPIYRFAYLVQKANEFCSDVKALGSAVLSALEKKDGEELSRLRASQEVNMLERVTGIRERQVLAAKASIESLLKNRETAELRLEHYNTQLLGNESITLPDSPTLDATLTANSRLPVDTSIPLIDSEVDMSLVGSDESGATLIHKEKEVLDKNNEANLLNGLISTYEALSSIYAAGIPTFKIYGAPLGTGVGSETGGITLSSAASSLARATKGYTDYLFTEAGQAGRMATYIRRENDWTLQANLVIREIIQLDKQITSADIQIQVAEKELQNHHQQIDNSKQTELFLKDKFTNQELYQWMKEQLFTVYKQSYNLAYEMAKKAEKAYQYELGIETTSYIQYGYWDNSKEGLLAGEKLQLSLRQLDKSFLEDNRRELEIRKNISMVLTNPLALLELRETGRCLLSLPEVLFDMDFPGHYFRRVKAVSLSIPCIAGPYTSVNCTLRLVKNSMRINTQSPIDYEHENDEGFLLDDNRFRSNNVPVTSIATSSGQNDSGMFEFNFRDERYLPFERAGAISDWQLELSTEKELRQFDYSTITDVVLHLNYTAREGSASFKKLASDSLRAYLKENGTTPSIKFINLKHDFPTEWHKFKHPDVAGIKTMELLFTKNHFSFRDAGHKLKVNSVTIISKGVDGTTITPKINLNGIDIPEVATKADLHTNELNPVPDGTIDFSAENRFELEFTDVVIDEIGNVYVLLGYEWDD